MTMINSYYLLTEVRSNLQEVSEAHWYDREILRKLNQVQMELAMHLMMTPGAWILKSGSLSFSGSEAALPTDCAKPVYLEEDSSGAPIPLRINVADRRVSRLPNYTSDAVYEAWLERAKIVVNVADYSEACTLWYHERVPDLHAGTAGASSGASALHLDADNEPRFADDYYNNSVVEVIDQTSGVIDISSIISDYAGSTKVMTITGTPASGDFYGTISKLPDECYSVLVLKATLRCLSKPSAAIDDKYYERFSAEQKDSWLTLKQWLTERANDARHTRITEMYD